MTTRSATSAKWPLRVVLAAVAVALVYFGASYYLRPIAVVALATTGTAVRTVPGTVEVKAEVVIELKSEVGGRDSARSLDVGKRVFKNDTLVQIDTGDVDLDIERIKNEITAAKKKVDLGSTLRNEVLNSKDTLDTLERETTAGAYPPAELGKQKRPHPQLEQKMEPGES